MSINLFHFYIKLFLIFIIFTFFILVFQHSVKTNKSIFLSKPLTWNFFMSLMTLSDQLWHWIYICRNLINSSWKQLLFFLSFVMTCPGKIKSLYVFDVCISCGIWWYCVFTCGTCWQGLRVTDVLPSVKYKKITTHLHRL